MFRAVRRKQNEISLEVCKELLVHERRGILSVIGDEGYPYGVPVNYYYDVVNHKIYFHGGHVGHKVEAIQRCDKVCFTVVGNEQIKDDVWAPYLQSVVVFGRCHQIENEEMKLKLIKQLAMKYYPSEEMVDEEIELMGKAVCVFEITIEHLSGKEDQEK